MNDKNNKKKKGSPIGAIIFIALALVLANIDNSDAAPVIIGIAAVAVFIAIIAAFSKAAKKNAGTKSHTAQKASAPKTYSAPAKRAAVKADCDYGEDNCEYSHDERRRVQQLNAFLKNGTIDREEYRVLLERYRRETAAADYHKS